MVTVTGRRVIRQQYILAAARGSTVLDIGCVAANRLQELHLQIKRIAMTCVGMDISAADGIVQGDAQNFDLGRQFDLIVAGEIIEHLADVRGFLRSCMRSLVPGGRMIVTTPNPYSFVALRHALFGQAVPNDPYHVLLLDATVAGNLMKNYEPGFSGEIHYYEEAGSLTFPYRVNRWVSRWAPRFSCGLLLDLRKAA